ncbi:hypothetical protein CUN35_10205 [Enterococcus faecium]|nr:hypothetical protein CUN35_10205 [Enterococcus faecium]
MGKSVFVLRIRPILLFIIELCKLNTSSKNNTIIPLQKDCSFTGGSFFQQAHQIGMAGFEPTIA